MEEMISLLLISVGFFAALSVMFGVNAFSIFGNAADGLKSGLITSFRLLHLFGFLNKKSKFENARFAGFWERFKLLRNGNDGLLIGDSRLSLNDSFAHLVLMAPTGVGKTTRYVLPQVFTLDHSMVITDPSGEIFRATSGDLKKRGFKIKVLKPTDYENSLRYNPLARMKTHDDVQKLVEILINSAYPTASGDQVFWNNSGKTILSVLLKVLQMQPLQYQNLANLKHLLNNFGEDGKALNHLTSKLDEQTFSELRGFLSQDVKVIQSAISTAQAALQPFSNPNLARLTAFDNLEFENLREEKTALFIILPEHEIKRFSFLLAVLYHQLFAYCLEAEATNPIFFILEEFGNVGKLPNFSSLITTLRKRKVSLSLILQDQNQLDLVYGKTEAEIIISGGCQSKLFFQGLSLSTCERLSKVLGQTIAEETIDGRTRKDKVSLLAPSEIRMMECQIFIHHNAPPIKLNLRPYYKIRRFKKAAECNPYEIKESEADNGKLEYIDLKQN